MIRKLDRELDIQKIGKINRDAAIAQCRRTIERFADKEFEFRRINIYYPTIEEQEKIVDFLTAIDRKIPALAQQIDLTEQLKKGLLQKMFV